MAHTKPFGEPEYKSESRENAKIKVKLRSLNVLDTF